MTSSRITQEVREAAEYVVYGHRYIPLDHPDMQAAHRTLQAAGVWAPGEVVSTRPDPARIDVVLVGVFCAGNRHRTLYCVMVDGIEIGTAVHWSSKSIWPWGLTLPAGHIVNFGFRDRASLVRAVERFVKTGGSRDGTDRLSRRHHAPHAASSQAAEGAVQEAIQGEDQAPFLLSGRHRPGRTPQADGPEIPQMPELPGSF